MDPRFSAFVLDELRILHEDLAAGLRPSNDLLNEVVTRELREQYERAQRESA